ncbi:MAG: PAS domain S-box protein [Candidatus Hydrogenedentes bacterium]|nr:PAS domain S-box protein [Candidatus Hydrogenedentota bacterium]
MTKPVTRSEAPGDSKLASKSKDVPAKAHFNRAGSVIGIVVGVAYLIELGSRAVTPTAPWYVSQILSALAVLTLLSPGVYLTLRWDGTPMLKWTTFTGIALLVLVQAMNLCGRAEWFESWPVVSHHSSLHGVVRWLLLFTGVFLMLTSLYFALLETTLARHRLLEERQDLSREIAERARIEKELRESEAKFQDLYENAPDMLASVGLDGIIIRCNQTLARMTGYTKDALVDRSIFGLFHPNCLAEAKRALDFAASSRERLEIELDVQRKDSSVFTVSVNTSAVRDGAGAICHGRFSMRDLTDRKRAEAELDHIRAFARCLLWHGDVELRDGQLHWSISVPSLEAAQRYLPLNVKPGQTYFEALGESRAEFPHVVDQLNENALRVFTEGHSHLRDEFPCRRSDGELRWIYEDAYIEPLGPDRWRVAGVSTDITERKREEENLKQGLSLLAATLESTADGILAVSRDGKMISHNKKFQDMWRIPAALIEEGDDRRLLKFVMDQLSDPKAFLKKVDELYAAQDSETHDVLEFSDGRVFERFSRPQWVDGKSVGRVWSFRDITDQRLAEEERQRFESQLLHSQKLESLGVLAGGIAHDFNNILTSILGNTELALNDIAPEAPVHSTIRMIEVSARRAAELTRQMLAYSGKGTFYVEPIRLSDKVQELIVLLETSISKKCQLTRQLADDLPFINADATQIRQVIMNLIINASEAIGDSQGEITVTTGAMDCDREYLSDSYLDDQLPAGRYVFLEVGDTGCGIASDVRARLFDPFFSTKFPGRGLGLAAVMGIVRSHRGVVRVTSNPGHGASFRVLFPAAARDTASAGKPADYAYPPRNVTGTVLVVDDEQMVRDLAKTTMERAGFSVLTAVDGRDGVDVFRQHASEIDVVLLDMTMPHMDGGEAFREIRRLRSDAKIVLSSGYSEEDAMGRFGELGLAGFIQKPYRITDLFGVICKAMESTV